MAKKKSAKAAAGKKRYRRTDEELIADLKSKISMLKNRAEAKKLKESPAIKSAMAAVRQIDKGLKAAKEESDSRLRHALAAARKPIEDYMGEKGVKLPKADLPRGRKPK